MRRHAAALALAASLLGAGAGTAAAASNARVDDSGTRVAQPLVNMEWRKLVPGRKADHTVQGIVGVVVRLNLAPWINRNARVYMALDHNGGPPVLAAWSSQGRLMPGALRSGGRALVYEGRITSPVLEEGIELVLTADGRHLEKSESLQFYFEIETP